MSGKSDVDEDIRDEEVDTSPKALPAHQYSRSKLFEISKSPAAQRRPDILERAYDGEEGKWDPERWYKAKFGSRESSPLTLGEGKDRRRVVELDRDPKRRPSLNDPVERLKESERDGIVLSPQRRSFGTGCHVQQSFTRQLSMPERDKERDDPRAERDRDRDRPIRKVGSGRIQIDRENSRDINPRDFSGLRDRHDDRDRDREYGWRDRAERDRDREREWDRERERDRDFRDTEWDRDRDRDRDRRFERSDRYRRPGDREFPERDRRERDFRDNRGYDRSGRRRNYHEEKEPEWFTGGPTSQNDTIELRGFKENDIENENPNILKRPINVDAEKIGRNSVEERESKDSAGSEDVPEADGIQSSQCSSPEEDQQNPHQDPVSTEVVCEEHIPSRKHPQDIMHLSPAPNTLLDFDQILKASFPLDEKENVRQGSRFTQFFARPGFKAGSETSSIEDMLVPQDLLEDRISSPAGPSPITTIGPGPMGAMQHHHLSYLHFQEQQQLQQFHQHQQQQLQQFHDQQRQAGGQPMDPSPVPPANMAYVPHSAGDNNGGQNSYTKAALPPSVSALFNTAAAIGGSSASLSSNNSFSTQDAEAQLKAMLFGGPKDSASSSGTASPANLPPGVQHKVKTVAELEADMHQNSPKKVKNPLPTSITAHQAGDMTAFNKLLIMMNAASEANQNAVVSDPLPSGQLNHGILTGNSEFNHALLRNKEEQLQLLHQSMQTNQRPPLPQQHGMLSQLPHQMGPPVIQHKPQVLAHPQGAPHSVAAGLPNKGMTSHSHSLTPQAMSTPHPVGKPRAQSGGLPSGDPIFNLIQQHPAIVMNPASPGPPVLPGILASQQSAVPNTARVPSPLMFSQQPPLHLSAPSPIHPSQLSPRAMTVGATLSASTIPSPSGVRSPVPPRIPSPQELSAHAQKVMINALLKKQLQDQSERYQKKQQERAKSPNQQHVNVVKPQPLAQAVIPPNPQPKGATLDTFTPTSVLRRMHSDKAMEKEKQAQEGKGEEEQEFMPSMQELSVNGPADHQVEGFHDKLKLSLLAAEKPGYLSQMLDKSKAAAEASRNAGQGRPIVKAPVPPSQLPEDRIIQPQHQLPHLIPGFHQMQQPPPPTNMGSRPVTGGPGGIQVAPPSFSVTPTVSNTGPQMSNSNKGGLGGRAIVGSSSVQQHQQLPTNATNADMMRLLEQQQQLQQMQRMAQPPPPLPPTALHHLGPPPVGMPIGGPVPMMPASMNNAMQHQMARAHATAQRNQQLSMMAMQQRGMAPLPPLHTMGHGVAVSSPLSPQNAGPLSPAALSVAIQRVASPHGALKMNGPQPPVSSMIGGGMVDLHAGIQRWFSPDILKTQLPSMPPLPTQGSHVMTVDELERN